MTSQALVDSPRAYKSMANAYRLCSTLALGGRWPPTVAEALLFLT